MKNSFIQKYTLKKPIHSDIEKAIHRVLQSGRLFRYSDVGNFSEVSHLEQEFADYMGAKYALATASCTAAINIALNALDVKPGDEVLCPAFTFVAVPSVIFKTGARVRLVEVTDDYYLDAEDLKKKITDRSTVLVLSYMRGHVGNIDEVIEICDQNNIKVIEDCAHTLGMRWKGEPVGRKGVIACYSMQSNKMIDSGEGGILITDDDEICEKAIYCSGVYERLWESHKARPKDMSHFRKTVPCINARMNNLTAAIIRTQLPHVEEKVRRHNRNYQTLVQQLRHSKTIYVPQRPSQLEIAADSIQFRLMDFTLEERNDFHQCCEQQGLPLHVFDGENARCFWNWEFLGEIDDCKATRDLIRFTFDLKLPHDLDQDELVQIGSIILGAVTTAKTKQAVAHEV